jgi:hypothetical protein
MRNGTVRNLAYLGKERISIVGGVRNYFYYYSTHYNEDEDQIEYVLHRADAITGNIIAMPMFQEYTSAGGVFMSAHGPSIRTIIGDEILWDYVEPRELDGKEVNMVVWYLTDFDLTYKRYLDFGEDGEDNEFMMYQSGDYFFAFTNFPLSSLDESEQVPWHIETLRNMNTFLVSAKLGTVIAESVITFRVHGNKIYYIVPEDEPEHTPTNSTHEMEQLWNWSGGKMYVMNLDGTDKRLIADTGYNFSLIRNPIVIGAEQGIWEIKTINGVDYIAISYTVFIDGWGIVPSSDTIIINASTGEWTVVGVPEW